MAPVSRQDVEHEKSMRRLREQFHGKSILLHEARKLMKRYNHDYVLVTRAIVAARDHGLGESSSRSIRVTKYSFRE